MLFVLFLLAINLNTGIGVIDAEHVSRLQVSVDQLSGVEGLDTARNVPEGLYLELLAGPLERLVNAAERDEFCNDAQSLWCLGNAEELDKEVRVGRNVHQLVNAFNVLVKSLRCASCNLKK